AQEALLNVLQFVQDQGDKFDDHHISNVMMGQNNQPVSSYKHDEHPLFGRGKEEGIIYWKSFFRQAVLENFLSKDIENYGLLRMTEKGREYLKKPYSIKFILNQPLDKSKNINDSDSAERGIAVDATLLKILKDLRRKIAKQKSLPPFVIFQDPSLEEMCIHYPITI